MVVKKNGPDNEIYDLVAGLVGTRIIHPSTNDKDFEFTYYDEDRGDRVLKRVPEIRRYKEMVDSIDLLLIAPDSKTEKLNSFPWLAYRYAQGQNKPVVLLLP